MSFIKNRILLASVTMTAIFFVSSVHSQSNQQVENKKSNDKPSNQWQTMEVVPFDAGPYFVYPPASPENKKMAQSIWQKEIDAMPMINISGRDSKQTSEVLIASHEDKGITYIFSIMNGGFSNGCIPPGNGSGIVDQYSTCPLRVVALNKSTGGIASQEFNDYCYLFINDKNNPAAKNHTEIAIDNSTGIAKFRVIQYGKVVPECNKSLRYKIK